MRSARRVGTLSATTASSTDVPTIAASCSGGTNGFRFPVSAYVDRSLHRGGIGRELYLALFDRLKQRGYRLLVAGITVPNEASVGFHQALGFQRVGVYKNIGFKFGRWYDVGWWQLDLGEPG